MADEFRAMRAGAKAGAAIASLACCAELLAKQPITQGVMTIAVASTPCDVRGHNNKLRAMPASSHSTAGPAPHRSMRRVSTRLPTSPKTPNHRKSRLMVAGEAARNWRQ